MSHLTPRDTCWARIVGIVLVMAMLATFLPAAATPAPQPVRVQPLLQALAQDQPQAFVSVIVQKLGHDAAVEEMIGRLGGLVTRDLRIINAVVANLPAAAVLELGAMAGVRWISLDAATSSASDPGQAIATISQSSDDAEEEGPSSVHLGPGGMYLVSTDLELTEDLEPASSGNQIVGLRFNGLNIPQGAAITGAHITFRAVSPDSPNTNNDPAWVLIAGQASDSPATFGSTRYNISNRPRTTATVDWQPQVWRAGTDYATPDLATIVQELVNRTGWSSGNSMAFFISGSGSRSAESFDNSGSTPPRLVVDYLVDPGPAAEASLTAGPATVTSGELITVTMRLTAREDVPGVVPSSLAVTASQGAGAFLVSGPEPASATVGPEGASFSWLYRASAPVSPGQLEFVGAAAAGAIVWDGQLSNPVAVNPPPDPMFLTWAPGLSPQGEEANLIEDDFKDEPIRAGTKIWFSSVIKVGNQDSQPVTVFLFDSIIQFTAGGVDYQLEVPKAQVTYSPAATEASTVFDPSTETWITTVPPAANGKEVFLTGITLPVGVDLPPKIDPVEWSGHFTTDRPELDLHVDWKWAAAVYSELANDNNSLGIKPIKHDRYNPYLNSDKAGTPENYKSYLIPGARGIGGSNYTGDYSGSTRAILTFHRPDGLSDAVGLDGTFAYGSKVEATLSGFEAEVTPGYAISQVELILYGYAGQFFDKETKIKTYVAGEKQGEVRFSGDLFAQMIGPSNAGTLAIDITGTNDWQWADFDDQLEIVLDQSGFDKRHVVYYDAIGLRVTARPGIDYSGGLAPTSLPKEAIDTSQLASAYNFAVRATDVWNEGPAYLQGQDVTVAMVDSGIGKNKDIEHRNLKNVNFNRGYHDSKDRYGHGTFVAGVIAGSGKHSGGERMGIAPKVNLINVRVSDDQGVSTEGDVIEALQWILENRDLYNIRVVNLSLNSTVPQSYHTSPLDAAVEILWFNRIVVVVSAGNSGAEALYPPANDPFVITVGASDDRGTPSIADDLMAGFSAYGMTADGFAKPDLVAPGRDIISYVPKNNKLEIGKEHPTHQVDNSYFRMSGTSMAAPMVSGAVALLLQDEPNLTPDQVKYRLKDTANTAWPGYDPAQSGAGYLDIYAAIHGTSSENANTGIDMSQLLWTGPGSPTWGSVQWDSVQWDSVQWDSVQWDSVQWDSVQWDSDHWDD